METSLLLILMLASQILKSVVTSCKKKVVLAPHGNGVRGVIAQQRNKLKLLLDKQYIHDVHISSDFVIVTTFIPALVSKIQYACATLYDNTYKRINGEWAEWEVVIFDTRLNKRK